MKMSRSEQFKSRDQRRQEVASDGIDRVTLSLYRYVAITDPHTMRDRLFDAWYSWGCLGRIYVATEGINAQMSVPRDHWADFEQDLRSIPEFADVPFKFAVVQDNTSFFTLTVKVKNKIVADGLDDDSFDSSDTGGYITASEMNDYIDDPDAVVIDVRNAYEAEVGHFTSARIMETDTFRDQLAGITSEFSEHKDSKIALYCTGGIRCEKASAWMKHNGFKHVHHLEGGIIDYAHQVKEQGLENKFRGSNFVFDERLGEMVGETVISHCHLCGIQKSDQYTHCRNTACHILFIACDSCLHIKQGYCNYICLYKDKLPQSIKKRLARLSARNTDTIAYKKHKMKNSR